jgi:hypothetical protein
MSTSLPSRFVVICSDFTGVGNVMICVELDEL